MSNDKLIIDDGREIFLEIEETMRNNPMTREDVKDIFFSKDTLKNVAADLIADVAFAAILLSLVYAFAKTNGLMPKKSDKQVVSENVQTAIQKYNSVKTINYKDIKLGRVR